MSKPIGRSNTRSNSPVVGKDRVLARACRDRTAARHLLRWRAVRSLLVGGERGTQTRYRLRRSKDQRNGAHGNSQSQLRPRRNSFRGGRSALHWSAFAVMGGMGGCRRASGIYPLGSRATCVRRTPSSRDASRRIRQAQRRSTTVPVGVEGTQQRPATLGVGPFGAYVRVRTPVSSAVRR